VSLSGESPFEIFQLDAESSGDPSTPRLSEVRGRLFLSVLRPRVVVRAPARPGAVLAAPGDRVRIVDTWPDRRPIEVRLRRQFVAPAIFGEALTTPPEWLLLHNPARGECVRDGGGGGRSWRPSGLPLKGYDMSWSFGGGGDTPLPAGGPRPWTAPSGWLQGAELVLFAADEVQRLDVPFELAHFPAMSGRP